MRAAGAQRHRATHVVQFVELKLAIAEAGNQSIGPERTSQVGACRQCDHIAQPGHGCGGRVVGLIGIPKLPIVVAAPAGDAAILLQGAGVALAHAQPDHIGEPDDRDRCGTVGSRSVAKLAVLVPAPARNRSV
ncbi:hypothetical protein FQZ97_1147960 [compost metagenome]